MSADIGPILKRYKEQREKYAKSELKANRKRNSLWKTIPNYPCPSQVIAMRNIAPRGYQSKWKDGDIDTFIPYKRNGEYGFELVNTLRMNFTGKAGVEHQPPSEGLLQRLWIKLKEMKKHE